MKILKLIYAALLLTGFITCQKEETQSLPKLSTSEIHNITDSSVVISGNILNDGNTLITVKGICWNTNVNPTISDFKIIDSTKENTINVYIPGLKPGTTYHIRTFATNSIGTAYGLDTSFITNSVIPIAKTTEATSITYQSAQSGGVVVYDGGSPITARGICWGTSQNPLLSDNKTNEGLNTVAFSSSMIKLNPNTTYYYRAYATNKIGTGYGEIKTFKTKFVTDFEGNVYNSVTIGSQVWLVENLKTIHYQNGDYITNATNMSGTNWTSLTTGVYCNNLIDSISKIYGRLYNWYAVTDSRKICPSGWHVPTIAEWNNLINYLGGESIAGGKLKETGTAHWLDPNTGATDEVGFKALAGGRRYYAGGFQPVGEDASWWASTESSSSSAWNVWTRNTYIDIRVVTAGKTLANSVRCIKD